MTFVFPILLGGLVFAGLPVLLHFLIRQKPKTLLFPAFRFLLQKQRSNTRNLRLRHLLLMLLRIALIVLLCFALSRPRLFYESLGLSREKPVAMVLVFDTSPSMDYKSGETTRLDLVKKRALELLEPLPDDCRVMILDTADSANFGRADFVSLDKARQRVQGLAIRPIAGSVNRAIEEALGRFQRWDDPAAHKVPKFVCVFSDRTKASWDGAVNLQRSDDVRLLYFDVGIDDPVDLAITHVEFAHGRQSFTEGESIELHAIVKATGKDVENDLEIGGQKNNQAFSIKKDQQETITLTIDPSELKLGVGFHQVDIRFKTARDALSFNNKRFATFEIRKKPRVLVLTDDLKKGKRLAETLDVLLYDAERKTLDDKARYLDYEAIFLVEAAAPDAKVWQALAAFVEQGGGLAVIPGGDELNLRAYDTEAARKLLPTRFLAKFESKVGIVWDLDANDLQHRFMRPFHGWLKRDDIDFLKYKRLANKYWEVERFKPEDGREVLVEYAGPARHPAIVERRMAKSSGKVLLLTTPMDEREPAWNNYGKDVTSFYLTLTWLAARHLVAESARVNLNHVFGQAMPTVRQQPALPRATLTGPDLAEEIHFDAQKEWKADRLPRDGHYAVTASNPDTQQSKVIARFSVNIPGEESDLARVAKEQIETALGKGSIIPQDQHTPLLDTIVTHWDEPVELFPILMIVLLLMFALENLIANKFYRQEPQA